MDNSDLEWKLFRNTVTSTIFAFSLHSGERFEQEPFNFIIF